MTTPNTQLPSEPAVASSDGLESVKRFNQFTWWTADGRTTVGDYDCNQIEVFPNILDEALVIMWCHGYETGHAHGMDKGKFAKAFEIKRALGL
jgi:hypothetical protein